jgi:multimeric flavodoxin WrbA
MREFIATFHTHLAALMTCRNLNGKGAKAGMMPVPRKLSSSCGTCVRYFSEDANLCAMDEDVEAVYEKIGKEDYILLMNAE